MYVECIEYRIYVDSYVFPITGTDWHRTSANTNQQHLGHQHIHLINPFEDSRSRLSSICTRRSRASAVFEARILGSECWAGRESVRQIFPSYLFPSEVQTLHLWQGCPCLDSLAIHWPWEILPWFFCAQLTNYLPKNQASHQIKSFEIHDITCWEAIKRHLTKPLPLRSAVFLSIYTYTNPVNTSSF